jgi:antitoxin YefM
VARRVSYDEFRKNLATYMEEVSAGPLFIASAAGCAVLMSEQEFEGWKETVYLLQSPANAQQLLAGIRAANDGKLVEHGIIDGVPDGHERNGDREGR